jgi:hypothetical protein
VVEEVAVRFAKQNAESSFGLASELANARDMQDVPGIQGRYDMLKHKCRPMPCRRKSLGG